MTPSTPLSNLTVLDPLALLVMAGFVLALWALWRVLVDDLDLTGGPAAAPPVPGPHEPTPESTVPAPASPPAGGGVPAPRPSLPRRVA